MINRKFSFFLFIFSFILIALYLRQSFSHFIFIALAIILAVISAILRTSSSIKLKKTSFFLLAISLGLILGTAMSKRTELSEYSAYIGVKIEDISDFTGYLVKDSIPTKEGRNIYVINLMSVTSQIKDITCSAKGKVKVFTVNSKKLYAGQIIKLSVRLKSTPEDSDVHFIAQSSGSKISELGFYHPLSEFRYSILRLVETNINKMGYPASSLFKALFLGMRENLPTDIYNGFQKTGTLHILALSGLHVGIIYFIITILLYFIPSRIVKFVLGSSFIFFYLFLVGPRPSLLRATIMLFIFGAAYFFQREQEPLNLLSISGCIILFLDPSWAFTLSFQLSFLALLGIIIIGGPISRFLRPYIPGFLCYPFACSIGAQVATAPLVLINFGKVYPVGIFVTIILVPIITIFIWTGIVFLFTCSIQIHSINLFARQFFMFIIKTIDSVISFFKVIPGIALDWKMWYWSFFILFLIPLLLNLKYIIKNISFSRK